MDLFQSIILGIVQGLTEFLPISSSGHLVIFQKLLGVKDHSIAFDVAAHLGTLLTVLTFYFKTTRQLAYTLIFYPKLPKRTPEKRLINLIIVGSVPTAIIGFSLKDYFEQMFSSTQAVGTFLMITGIILFISRNKTRVAAAGSLSESLGSFYHMKYWQAFVVGIAQGAAIAPGISRSGSTISASLMLGVDRQSSALFSFMLSIPAILGAGILQLKDVVWTDGVITSLVVGFFTAYIFGLLGLWGILYFVKKGRLEIFSYYLWIIAPIVIFYL